MNRILIFFVLFLSLTVSLCAQEEQNFILSGTVYDELNEPVPGANVYIKDKPGVGITTNIDGKFRLKVNIYDIVVVSFLGYENYEQRLTRLMPSMLFGDSLIVTTNGMARVVYSQSNIADMT